MYMSNLEQTYKKELNYLHTCGLNDMEAVSILLIALEYERPGHGRYGTYGSSHVPA